MDKEDILEELNYLKKKTFLLEKLLNGSVGGGGVVEEMMGSTPIVPLNILNVKPQMKKRTIY